MQNEKITYWDKFNTIESKVELRLVKDDTNKTIDSPDTWKALKDVYLTK